MFFKVGTPLRHGPIVDELDWLWLGTLKIMFPTYLDEKYLYFRYTSFLAYYETSWKNRFRNR